MSAAETSRTSGDLRRIALINYGYPLAGLLIMGAILGAWKKKTA